MHRLNISYKQFYVTLNEIWLFESDPNAPSTWSEPGGKQWQRSIRGRRNWDVELGPCAVIRHLCSVAFVWETKQPQADNSRSLIDRQVSCLQYLDHELIVKWTRAHHCSFRSMGYAEGWNPINQQRSYIFCTNPSICMYLTYLIWFVFNWFSSIPRSWSRKKSFHFKNFVLDWKHEVSENFHSIWF